MGTYNITCSTRKADAIYKRDGYFVFHDFPVSISPYLFEVNAGGYRPRGLEVQLPGPVPVEITFNGEDEEYFTVNFIDSSSNRIDFDPIPFLPVILSGADVFGPAGFTATLAQPVGGSGVTTAFLNSTIGLATGNLIRIRRSNSMVLFPNWTYRFDEPVTTLYITVLDSSPEEHPVKHARIELLEVNGNPVTSQSVGSLTLYTADVGSPMPHILGTFSQIVHFTDARGKGLIFFPVHVPVTSVLIQVSHPLFITQTSLITLEVAANIFQTVSLVHI